MKNPDTHDNQYLQEASDVQNGGAVRWVRKISGAFPAFQSRNYKLYFSGQLVSLIGTWLQIVAQGWLILQLTSSVFLIGLITALSTLPTLLFTLFGGLIVDRFSKKKILLYTQSSAMILAFLLGVFTLTGLVTIWLIGLMAFLLGMVMAVDAPARQAFVAELVNKEQLSSAIALNSGTFNAARVIGPGIAGLLIGMIGIGGAFIVNGLSFIGVLIALRLLHLEDKLAEYRPMGALKAIGEGIRYSAGHPVISMFLVMAGFISIFGWSFTTVIPLLAKNKFHLDATGLGYLYSSIGLGSLSAAILVGTFSSRIKPVLYIAGGSCVFSISIVLFTFTGNSSIAMFLLFFSGFGLLSQAATINTTIQTMVRPEFRGRVMSLYVLMFLGMTPIGNLQVGWVSEHLGVAFAIRLGAVAVMVMGILLMLFRTRILKAYHTYVRSQAG